MTTISPRSAQFKGPLAATGTARAEVWRFVACPREKCAAERGVKCRRRISESFHANVTVEFRGEGRWQSIKHCHPERIAAARELGAKVRGGEVSR